MNSRIGTVGAPIAATAWVGIAGWSTRPGTSDRLPVACPVHALTGLDCPGCGSTRALGALTRLDLAAAFDHNVIVPVAAVFMVVAWAGWTWAVWHDRRRVDLVRGRWPVLGVGVLLVGFAVFRNLPIGEWFAAGLSG